jgi:hypothetical protein
VASDGKFDLNNLKIGKIDESDSANQETKIIVNFIGDTTHSEVPLNKLAKFEEKFEEYSKTKKRSLINSITLARKILNGQAEFYNNLHLNKSDTNKKQIAQENVKKFTKILVK